MHRPFFEHDGVKFVITRRRYSNVTYSWVAYQLENGEWADVGDPWPCITPKRSEVIEAHKLHREWLSRRAVEVGYSH